jgi:hypothetical protein
VVVESSGTQTASIGTEHSLATPSTAKTRVLFVDASALASTEVLELRFKGAVLSAGTERLILLQSYTGVLADPGTQSPPIVMPQGGTITLKQTSGTGRAFPWSVITLD